MKKHVINFIVFTLISIYPSFGQKLSKAVFNNNYENVQALIEKGANVNEHSEKWCCPLMWAVFKNNSQMVELLLQQGAKSDTCPIKHTTFPSYSYFPPFANLSPFYLALKNNQINIIKQFYEYKYDIGKKIGEPEFTYPIIYSAQLNTLNIYNFLIDNGVDVTVKDYFGNSVLIYCLRMNSVEMINDLIQKGCSAKDVSKSGYTTLMYASLIVGINPEILKTLVNNGANVNFQNTKNQNAFSLACKHNNRIAALFLLEQGVKSSIYESDDETNARFNLFLGEFNLKKGDLSESKVCYTKSKELFNRSLSDRKIALSTVNAEKAGNIFLNIAGMALGIAGGIASGGQFTFLPTNADYLYNPYKKDKDNILIGDYQISENPSLDEEKVYCKNKIQQFEMSIKLADGTLACMEKGLTGEELNTCIDNIQLTKKK